MGEQGGRTGQRLRPLFVVGGVIALILGLAVAVPKVFPFLRGDRDAPLLLPDAPVVADYLIVAVSVVVVVAAVALRLKVASIADPVTARKRRPVLLQILIFVAIFWLTAFVVAQLSERREQQRGDTSVSEQGGDPQEVQRIEREGSRALGVMLTVILGGVIVVLAGSVYLITKRDSGARSTETAESLAEELALGVEDLRTGKDPRDVVIACYARMERVLQAAGAGGRPSDTPFQFVDRALRRLKVPGDSVRRLTELFERARFSPHGTDDEMRHEAITALEAVKGSLGERA